MKLSEAIRLGSTMKPQAFGSAFKDGGSCALGAAQDAAGEKIMQDLDVYWSQCQRLWLHCPVCDGRDSVYGIMSHLNDGHRWSRERIADWVEFIEAQIDPSECVVAGGSLIAR